MDELLEAPPDRLLDRFRREFHDETSRGELEAAGLLTADPAERRQNVLDIIFEAVERHDLEIGDLDAALECLNKSASPIEQFVGRMVSRKPELVERQFLLQSFRHAEKQLLRFKRRLPSTWSYDMVFSLRATRSHADELEEFSETVVDLAQRANRDLIELTGHLDQEDVNEGLKTSIYAFEIQTAKNGLQELLRATRRKHSKLQMSVLQVRAFLSSIGILLTGLASILVSVWFL